MRATHRICGNHLIAAGLLSEVSKYQPRCIEPTDELHLRTSHRHIRFASSNKTKNSVFYEIPRELRLGQYRNRARVKNKNDGLMLFQLTI
jgi:hypothetical protein